MRQLANVHTATHITAVRHGQTDWNVEVRVQGYTDIALNDNGRVQAQRVAQALAQEAFACIYTSDLSRAKDTAHAIAQHAGVMRACEVRVHTHTGLRERSLGLFEGKTAAEIAAQWPEEHARWIQREPDYAPAGGETPLQLRARVCLTFDALARAHPGEQIVVVTHGGVLDMLYRLATQQDIRMKRTWALENAAINRFLWTPDGLTLVEWANTHHLSAAHDMQG